MIFIKSPQLVLLGVLETVESLKTTKSYYGCGSFEMSCPFLPDSFELLKLQNCIQIDDWCGVIETVSYNDNFDGGINIHVTGREVKSILDRRIVWDTLRMSGSPEDYLREAVTRCFISPANADRIIDIIELGTHSGILGTIDKQATGSNVLELCESVCKEQNLGFDLVANGNKLQFVVYEGEEKPVKFASRFENVTVQDWTIGEQAYKNTCLIAGAGEGAARIKTSMQQGTGLGRREIYIDARDLQREEGVTDAAYTSLLLRRGAEKLAELPRTEVFDCEIIETNTKYGVDFNLGDVVTVINDTLMLSEKERVIEIERIYQGGDVSTNIILRKEESNG